MSELTYIKDKINTRIKSMANDNKGIYARRMMRRCIKDIDKVIEAKQISNKICSSQTCVELKIVADKTKLSQLLKWIKSPLGRKP